ncbi:uncharacterized protein EAE98_010000 [Botrytis deweyae]|uniref:Uncharacterized protein n=1 Tax=Botrytis deweyae TaxID=2478750 RepID=A0ABQ7IA30_9HELO|nr:uncharacterized protein EAE98_010000 [Botrytis deweyae]KAF7917972.1 hypothetical protein EAE98_010000 [Botrytis deweyae]
MESQLPFDDPYLHVRRETEEPTDYDGIRRRPCYFRRLYDGLFPRKTAGKTVTFHNTNDLTQLATEINLLKQKMDSLFQERDQARIQNQAFSQQLENFTRENNELNTRCEKLQHDISVCFNQRKSCEAAAEKTLEDLDSTKSLLQAKEDELHKLEHKYNTVVMDQKSQAQKHQNLLENFEIQKRQNLTLSNELTTSNNQNRLTSNCVDLPQKLEALEEEIEYHKQKAMRFREIIQKSNAPMEINEIVICEEFKWLREEIHRIIHRFYTMRRVHPVRRNPTLQIAENYLSNLFSLGLEQFELQNAVRAFVFGHLDQSLLLKPFFGLEHMDESLDMQLGLRNFETMLNQDYPDKHDEIAEWRTVTMKCAKLLQPVDPSRLPSPCIRVAKELMWLLDPLLKHPQNETDQLMGRWQTLCMNALKFTIKLRYYKDVYRCEVPLPGNVLNDDEIDVQSEVRREDDCKKYAVPNGWTIAYALSGALVRYSAEEPETKVVLVKPWVVTYARPGESK